jgi:hypothetical protein
VRRTYLMEMPAKSAQPVIKCDKPVQLLTCQVCGLEFRSHRTDAKTCTTTCRQRLHRGHAFAYLTDLPPAQARARRAVHEAQADALDLERAVRAAYRERRRISRRTVRELPAMTPGLHRGGGFSD